MGYFTVGSGRLRRSRCARLPQGAAVVRAADGSVILRGAMSALSPRSGARLREILDGEGSRLRLVYFLFFATAGTALPFLAKYLKDRGFTGDQVGTVQMLPGIPALFAGVLWARVAERIGNTVRVIGWVTAWAAFCALFLPFARTPLAVGAVLILMAIGDRGLIPMLDSLSVGYVRKHPGTSYSHLRMYGSIGFAVLATVLGYVLAWRGNLPGDPIIPWTIAGFAVAYAIAARRLIPEPVVASERGAPGDLWVLLGNARLVLLLVACSVHWLACMPYTLWMGRFVDELRLPPWVTGWGMTAGVVAEVSVMMVFPWLARRFAPRALLATVFLGSALRWWLLSWTTSPAAVIALQLFHGLSYGLFWTTMVQVVTDLVPSRMRATGLALCAASIFGVGTLVGAKLIGWGHDQTGSVARLFGIGTWIDLAVALVVFVLPAHGAARTAADGGAGRAR
jgi:PPP family 3-phenylpropionic acid transporter